MVEVGVVMMNLGCLGGGICEGNGGVGVNIGDSEGGGAVKNGE